MCRFVAFAANDCPSCQYDAARKVACAEFQQGQVFESPKRHHFQHIDIEEKNGTLFLSDYQTYYQFYYHLLPILNPLRLSHE